ncbi:hypothetical protein [Naasia aerilata]|uniref:Uncharacterized protein n=1 Tax=Naasia aerilata TaxID=1162966 RepID=A0ABM8GFX6_9MICO|nr:hypothetical protein [Naasia aerilata]BDZ47254.1 hypothetical protein GCM10025866_31630 [Naasia aerilata]
MFHLCHLLATQCDEHQRRLTPVLERYGEQQDGEPERFHAEALTEARTGPVGLLRDLQDVYVLVSLVSITWTIVEQAGKALRDEELLGIITACSAETGVQQSWLSTRIKQAAPQALLVAS